MTTAQSLGRQSFQKEKKNKKGGSSNLMPGAYEACWIQTCELEASIYWCFRYPHVFL